MRHQYGSRTEGDGGRQDWRLRLLRARAYFRTIRCHRGSLARASRLQSVRTGGAVGRFLLAPILFVSLSLAGLVSGTAVFFGRIVWAFASFWLSLAGDAWDLIKSVAALLKSLIALIFDFSPPSAGGRNSGPPPGGRFNDTPEAAVPVQRQASPEDQALIRRALAEAPERGDDELPQDLATLAVLLSDPLPARDFTVADMVRDCFADFGASGIRSRALLAVALHLSRHFARPTHLPLATLRAWRSLDAVTFEEDVAEQLSVLSRFILDWQKTQATFLVLDHAEIELIELLFESVHPARHPKQMVDVLDFKVLSNRRQGLLRRIPHRLRKVMQELGTGPEGMEYLEGTRAFLDGMAKARHYQPIVDAAATALEEVTKLAEKLAPAPALAAPQGGQALARIQPVKIPASELADRAQREAGIPAAPSAPASRPPAAAAPTPPPRPQAAPPPAPSVASVPVSRQPRGAVARVTPAAPPMRAQGTPYQPRPGIGVSASATKQMVALSTVQEPFLGKRARLPDLAFRPLPELTGSALLPGYLPRQAEPAATRQPSTVSGKISLPAPGAKPVITPQVAAKPAQAAATQQATPPRPAQVTGRVVPRPALAESDSKVTDLTVVPRKKRPPITQAVKRQSVLKVLRGESSSAIAASLGIRESKLDEWVDAFVAAGAGALTPTVPRERKPRRLAAEAEPLSAELLRAKLAEVLATAQMIERAMEAQLQTRRPMLLPPPQPTDGSDLPRRPRRKG